MILKMHNQQVASGQKVANKRLANLGLTDEKELIIVSGTSLLQAPLGDVLAEHYLRDASITSLVKEVDMVQIKKKQKERMDQNNMEAMTH